MEKILKEELIMLVKILVNNTNNSNGYIKGTIELNLLKEALEKNVITENSYYYLKDKIIKEYKIF